MRHPFGLLPKATAILLALAAPSIAQGTINPEALDRIIGTEVQEEQANASADAAKVLAAIDKAPEAAATIRKTSNVAAVDIVFLADAAQTEGGPPPEIEAKVKERAADISALRQELEGNAMLYHAIESRQVMVRDVLAVEFDGEERVVIYAAAKPPAR